MNPGSSGHCLKATAPDLPWDHQGRCHLERVLRVVLADLTARQCGYDLIKAAKLPSGTSYPMPARPPESEACSANSANPPASQKTRPEWATVLPTADPPTA
jgi:hypothetical protein